MISVVTGFITGSVHVFAGPDHLSAISPLAIENNKSASTLGLRWGLGHTTGVFLLGFVALLFREAIPIEAISNHSEKLVGIILIFIGLWGIKRATTKKIHLHSHTHNGVEHSHIHLHSEPHSSDITKKHNHNHAAFGIGVMHGLAGTSHIFGILPALALSSRIEAGIYLISFGLGTIISMLAYSTAIGILSRKVELSGAETFKKLLIGFSSITIIVGLFWIFNS